MIFGELIIIFWLGYVLLCVYLISRIASSIKRKSILASVLWAALLVGILFPVIQSSDRGRREDKARKEKYMIAKSIYDDHCRKAGEKIYSRAYNVRGIYLMRARTQIDPKNQYRLDDPYLGREIGDAYISSFLREGSLLENENGEVIKTNQPFSFEFVEMAEEDGRVFRYTKDISTIRQNNRNSFKLKKSEIDKRTAKYGVIWEDISTKNDRDYWVAGSSLKVVDLDVNEVMGERIGFLFNSRQGAGGGGGEPWFDARNNSCPEIYSDKPRPKFIHNVLSPIEKIK